MPWVEAKKKHREALKQFALKREWEHVTFSSKLKEYLKDQRIVFFTRTSIPSTGATRKIQILKKNPPHELHKNGYDIVNSLMLTRFGILLPVLFEKSPQILREAEQTLESFQSKMFSIIGTEEDVKLVSSILSSTPHTTVDYYLMVLQRNKFNNITPIQKDYGETGKFNLKVKLAHPRDTKYLFPLQRDYELEEVVLKRENYNPRFSMTLFRKSLEENIVLYGELDGEPIAKAGTNARGFITDQIGGVFTKREKRGKGIAKIIMRYLLSLIFQEKEYASLFVKKQNKAAINLYRDLGFETVNNFRIAYF